MKTRVKELRLTKKITQLQLSLAVGCSQNTISRIELGEIIPNGELLIELSKYSYVSIDYLLYQSDQKNPYPPTALSLSPRIKEYTKKLQQLSSDNKETIFVLIDHLASIQNRRD